MTLLIASIGLLIAGHVLPSAPGVRERLLAGLGRPAFYAAYSLFSLLALALVIWSYGRADDSPWLYTPPPWSRVMAVALMPVAIFLLVARLTTKPAGDAPHGIYRITAVPGSLAVLLWSALHLANVGEARTVALFVGMALIAVASLVRNWVRSPAARRKAGILPFQGILAGQVRPAWEEIGWGRLGLALAVYLALLLLHPLVIGPDPLAGVIH